MKLLFSFLLLFTVTVKVPWGMKKEYKHVQEVTVHHSGFVYRLLLEDGRTAQVPTQWTIIEEE